MANEAGLPRCYMDVCQRSARTTSGALHLGDGRRGFQPWHQQWQLRHLRKVTKFLKFIVFIYAYKEKLE